VAQRAITDAVARNASGARSSETRGSVFQPVIHRRVGDPRNFKQNTTCRTKHLCIQLLFQQGE
jgi:hypothetical protein